MSFAMRTGLLCALVLGTLGANRNDSDFVHFLTRMSTVAGPVWQAHIVSVSRLTLGGELNVASTDWYGLRISVRHCTGELCTGSYFDGDHLYTVNMNGTAIVNSMEPEPFLRALRIVASLGFLSPSFLAHGGRIGGNLRRQSVPHVRRRRRPGRSAAVIRRSADRASARRA
jgi:hypothetical protein